MAKAKWATIISDAKTTAESAQKSIETENASLAALMKAAIPSWSVLEGGRLKTIASIENDILIGEIESDDFIVYGLSDQDMNALVRIGFKKHKGEKDPSSYPRTDYFVLDFKDGEKLDAFVRFLFEKGIERKTAKIEQAAAELIKIKEIAEAATNGVDLTRAYKSGSVAISKALGRALEGKTTERGLE